MRNQKTNENMKTAIDKSSRIALYTCLQCLKVYVFLGGSEQTDETTFYHKSREFQFTSLFAG